MRWSVADRHYPSKLVNFRSASTAKVALLKTQEMAEQSFGLELRVAAIPVATIRAAGFDILDARVRVSDRAHMTCLVFNYSGRHLQFIDGADGGLFLAAKQFKERSAKLIAV